MEMAMLQKWRTQAERMRAKNVGFRKLDEVELVMMAQEA